MKQAPRAWYDRLIAYLTKHKFKRGFADTTLFVRKDKNYFVVTQIYVDDIVFGATNDSLAQSFTDEMKMFEMSMVGCKVEFIQPSNWLYSVPNLLVIQHLVTLYLGGFDVRVVSEIE